MLSRNVHVHTNISVMMNTGELVKDSLFKSIPHVDDESVNCGRK